MPFHIKGLTHILRKSRKYIYRCLKRQGMTVERLTYEDVMGLVAQHRAYIRKGVVRKDGKRTIRIIPSSIDKPSQIWAVIDEEFFADLYAERRRISKGMCEFCGGSASQIHHIDKNHGNMTLANIRCVCMRCHVFAHRSSIRYSRNG